MKKPPGLRIRLSSNNGFPPVFSYFHMFICQKDKIKIDLPSSYQCTLQRAQWIASNTLSEKGSLCVAITERTAGIPRSRPNWIWASCSSLGATDMVITFLSRRYPPKLATPQPTSRTTLVRFPHSMLGSVCLKMRRSNQPLGKKLNQEILDLHSDSKKNITTFLINWI